MIISVDYWDESKGHYVHKYDMEIADELAATVQQPRYSEKCYRLRLSDGRVFYSTGNVFDVFR